MAEKRLVHVEKTLSRQISVFPMSCCKILKFSIILLAYPVFLATVRCAKQQNKNPVIKRLSFIDFEAFFFCSSLI